MLDCQGKKEGMCDQDSPGFQTLHEHALIFYEIFNSGHV